MSATARRRVPGGDARSGTAPRGWARAARRGAGLLGLALVVLGAACARVAPDLTPSGTPWNTYFATDGRQVIAEATGQPVQFHGIAAGGMEYGQFRAPYPGREGVHYTTNSPGHYARLAALGFNVVRVPFDWGRLVLEERRELNPVYLRELDRIVNEYAAPNRLYVILDMHSYLRYWDGPGSWKRVDDSPHYHRLLADTWRLLASHYAANTTVLGYEIMNEPNPEMGDGNWHAIAQQVVEAIRGVDQRHLIFVDGRAWSSSEDWERANGPVPFVQDPISPPRIVYVPHVYFSPANNDHYADARPDLALMQRRLDPLAEWSRRNAVPVWIGESGVPNTPEWAALLDCAFTRYYRPLGWGHLYWEDSEWSTDPTRLGEHTLAVLQRHQAGGPGSPSPGPACADLPGE